MKSTKKWTNALWILNVIYLIVLTWLILLKGSVSLPAFGQFRSINLIPFGASLIVNGKLDLGEIWMNILAFIPLGLYTGLLHPRWPVGAWCLTGLEVSLLFEIIQYILGIGATDITDVITNTTGGVLGVLLLLLRSSGHGCYPWADAPYFNHKLANHKWMKFLCIKMLPI